MLERQLLAFRVICCLLFKKPSILWSRTNLGGEEVPDQANRALPEGGKARRVFLLLRDEIFGGAHAPGALLPAEQRLADRFGVSRVTVRRALDALVGEGLIEKRVGAGAQVTARAGLTEPIRADIGSLIPQLVEMGEATTVRLLSFSYLSAPDTVARAMGYPNGLHAQKAVRVRMVRGEPFSHLTTYVPEAIACNYSESDLATTPLFRLLERSGVRVEAAHQSVSAALASPQIAQVLGIAVGSALLSIRRIVRDATGAGVEYLDALYRPDVFRLHMDLNRVGRGEARHWRPVIGAASELAEAAE